MSRIPKLVREQVRQRADGHCEYCRKREEFASHKHQVDHIISQKHKGSDELINLAWACFQCNSCKGTNIAGIDPETQQMSSLYNPRTQVWQDHFELNSATLVGKTAIGRATIDVLEMNSLEQIQMRRLLIDNELWD
jgi:5-methylcytosine-specific restriction endonuclease McrA